MISYTNIKNLNEKIKDIEREEFCFNYYEKALITKQGNFQAIKNHNIEYSIRDITLKEKIRKFYITKT